LHDHLSERASPAVMLPAARFVGFRPAHHTRILAMSTCHPIHAHQRLARLRHAGRVAVTVSVVLSSLVAVRHLDAAIVYFPVSSGGSISQSGSGGQPTTVAFGNISLGSGTFSVAGDFADPISFGIGLNPPEAPQAAQFFSQSNNGVGWLLSSGTIALLSAGGTVGAGTYTSSDPNFGGDWKAGVSPGYAGLQMTSGSDVYYGWVSINYVLGSPNQATVTAFAFENQPNTPITVAAVPEPSALAVVASAIGAVALLARRWRRGMGGHGPS
jgi:hypothetical protein